jgi:hypothetical protein
MKLQYLIGPFICLQIRCPVLSLMIYLYKNLLLTSIVRSQNISMDVAYPEALTLRILQLSMSTTNTLPKESIVISLIQVCPSPQAPISTSS